MAHEFPMEDRRKRVEKKTKELSRTGWHGEHERCEPGIEELREAFKPILESLRADIEGGHITTLIGDDTSGRVPTIMLRATLKELNRIKGYDTPTTLFINGAGGGKVYTDSKYTARIQNISAYLNERRAAGDIKQEPHSKTLLVTEVIKTGGSLKPVLDACRALNIPTEVVSVGIESLKSVAQVQTELGVKVHVGMSGTPWIYQKQAWSGVVKEKPEGLGDFSYTNPDVSLFSKPYSKDVMYSNREDKQLWLNEVRRECRVAAHQLAEWFQKK